MSETVVKPPTALMTVYDRIPNPMEFVLNIGGAIADSKMFGCANVQQGRVLAMACLAERKSPMEVLRKYHILGGRLTMRADAMLADFKTLAGGSHRIVSRTPDKAAVELTLGKQKQLFEFTWAEAQLEDYVYTKDANDGKVPKVVSGSVNFRALKDNWSTPRRRMQMLWARCVSDAVRAMAPEVNAGTYTPEEFGSTTEQVEAGEIVDAEYTVIDTPKTEAAPFSADPLAMPEPVAAAAPEPTPAPPAPAPSTGTIDSQQAVVAGDPTHRAEMLAECKAIMGKLGITVEQWQAVLQKNYGAKSAKELDDGQIASVLQKLRDKAHKAEVAAGTDSFSQWAVGALAGGKAPGPNT